MSNALALRDPQNVAMATPNANQMKLTLDETIKLADVFAQSGLFSDIKGAAQAVTKIIAGRELGFPPIASMTGIYIVKGRVTMSANLIAAAIQRSGKYSYRVVEMTNKLCTINFYEQGQQIGASTFDEKDAQDAGLLNNDSWKKFRRNMLFARALTNGARWFTPEIFGGAIYTPEEFGQDVNEESTPLNTPNNMRDAINTMDAPPPSPTPGKIDRKLRLKQRIEQLWLEEDALELMVVDGDRPELDTLLEPQLEELGKSVSRRIKLAKEDILAREMASSTPVIDVTPEISKADTAYTPERQSLLSRIVDLQAAIKERDKAVEPLPALFETLDIEGAEGLQALLARKEAHYKTGVSK